MITFLENKSKKYYCLRNRDKTSTNHFIHIYSKQRHTTSPFHRAVDEAAPNRLSWPQFYQRNRSNQSNATKNNNEDDRLRRDSAANCQGSYALEKLCPDEARVIQRANQIVMYVLRHVFLIIFGLVAGCLKTVLLKLVADDCVSVWGPDISTFPLVHISDRHCFISHVFVCACSCWFSCFEPYRFYLVNWRFVYTVHIRKNKSFRPRERGKKGLKNLQSVKTLAGRTGITAMNQSQLSKARKQPMTVAAQFQQSLHSLMDTLNQANPFFIRCIKSNSNKISNTFDAETVQRQLRWVAKTLFSILILNWKN